LQVAPPQSIDELLARANQLAGLSLKQCALKVGQELPESLLRKKGFAGFLLEQALGADAPNQASPDFSALGIELKTIPIGLNQKPSESTFVTSIALSDASSETFESSRVVKKLSHVLWVPIEDIPDIPLAQRRIGQPFLWQPSDKQWTTLRSDWQELMDMIVMGDIEAIHGGIGEALHIRPKAANSKALTKAVGRDGESIKTLPRGFYLRASFTQQLLAVNLALGVS